MSKDHQSAPTADDNKQAGSTQLPRRRLLQAFGGAAGLATLKLFETSPVNRVRAQATGSGTLTKQQKLAANDGDRRDKFGAPIAISSDGTTALIGATGDDDPDEFSTGSAYVLTKTDDGWTEQQKLTAADGDGGDRFGVVSISGDGATALIGAPLDEDPKGRFGGSAYIFTRDGASWSQQQKLTAPSDDRNNSFGTSVSISDDGTTVFIGAPFTENNDEYPGSVYVFKKRNGEWIQQQQLLPDDGGINDGFGGIMSISADGTIIFIISTGKESTYVFTENNGKWNQQQQVKTADGSQLGDAISVSRDGATALIADSSDNNENGSAAGAVYVFTEDDSSWSQQQKLVSTDGDSNNYFGSSVSLSGDKTTIIVTSRPAGYTDNMPALHVFSRTNDEWNQQQRLVQSDSDQDDSFGSVTSISRDGMTAFVGAPFDDDPNGERAGSAYVFTGSSTDGPQPSDPRQRVLEITGRSRARELTQDDVSKVITLFNRDEAVNGVRVTQNDITNTITLFERD